MLSAAMVALIAAPGLRKFDSSDLGVACALRTEAEFIPGSAQVQVQGPEPVRDQPKVPKVQPNIGFPRQGFQSGFGFSTRFWVPHPGFCFGSFYGSGGSEGPGSYFLAG